MFDTGVLAAHVVEAVGSYYPRAGRWLPRATLPRFDPEAVRDSADRLRSFDADRLAMSHFGVRSDPEGAIDRALDALATFEARFQTRGFFQYRGLLG
jgi:hypothetical protein